jgi:uncharacterized protein
MDWTHLLILLGGGCVTGFLAGLFGVGGGLLMVPLLLIFYHSLGVSSLVATHLAFGTSLLTIIFGSCSSAYEHHKNNHVVWRAVAVMGVASVVGALAGSVVASDLPGKSLQVIFGVVALAAAWRMFAQQRKPKGEQKPDLRVHVLSFTGLFTGVVSSLAGVGGGVFSIPIMYSLLRFPLKKAVGTSSATIVITASAATLGYILRGWGNVLLPGYTLGYVDYLHAIPMIIGTVVLARFGANVANRTDTARLKSFFGVFLVVVAAKMIFF